MPRTVQPLPDPAEWENPEGDWNLGQSLFSRYDEDRGLMEGSVRLFLDECDSPQGIQVVPSADSTGTRKIINDALYLRSLNELASMSVPIQSPNAWPTEAWRHTWAELNNTYHVAAILSAHVETSTLPLRLKGRYDDLGTRYFPFNPAEGFERRPVNFSASGVEHAAKHHQFTKLDVSRGFSPSGLSAYEQWSAGRSLQDTYILRVHAQPRWEVFSASFPCHVNASITRNGTPDSTIPVCSTTKFQSPVQVSSIIRARAALSSYCQFHPRGLDDLANPIRASGELANLLQKTIRIVEGELVALFDLVISFRPRMLLHETRGLAGIVNDLISISRLPASVPEGTSLWLLSICGARDRCDVQEIQGPFGRCLCDLQTASYCKTFESCDCRVHQKVSDRSILDV
ncbi:putative tubulin domain containing protein [Lyophyllum shimeji]|uniref:Tubulin domain containing protein n=1 Tax=Lyophyllum shimeji TaxID=47721 RepID=A0A9P3PVQ0_LYOSH|nr:putative tubulin domain containing protein [Lyophyllum shimeji]